MSDKNKKPTKHEQVTHWLEQVKFQQGWMSKAFAEGDYNGVRRGFELMASMLINDAIPDARALENTPNE